MISSKITNIIESLDVPIHIPTFISISRVQESRIRDFFIVLSDETIIENIFEVSKIYKNLEEIWKIIKINQDLQDRQIESHSYHVKRIKNVLYDLYLNDHYFWNVLAEYDTILITDFDDYINKYFSDITHLDLTHLVTEDLSLQLLEERRLKWTKVLGQIKKIEGQIKIYEEYKNELHQFAFTIIDLLKLLLDPKVKGLLFFKKFIAEKEKKHQNSDLLLKSTKRKDWGIFSEKELYKLNFDIKMIEEFIDEIKLVIITNPLAIFNLNLREFQLFLISKQEEERVRFEKLLRIRIMSNKTIQRESSFSEIIEIISFYTWWSKNIATTIIKKNDTYGVFLILTDKSSHFINHHFDHLTNSLDLFSSKYDVFVYPDDQNCKKWGEKPRNIHNSLELAQKEAKWLRIELTKENGRYWNNPILLIHPECDIRAKFTDVCCYPYVTKEQINLPIDISNSELDKHFQIGDIIEVERQRFEGIVQYYHAGIYLGDGMICEMLFNKEDENNKIKITGIRLNKEFQEKFRENNQKHQLFKVHPIIPFKHISLIIKQTINSERVLWENNYHLGKRNCQHHAYSIVLGINYSWGIWEKRNFFSNGYEKIAKGKIPLRTLVPRLSETYLTVFDTIDTLSDIFNKSCSSNLDNIAKLSLNINNGKGEIIVLIKELEETNVLLDINSNTNKQLIEDIEQKYYEQIAPPHQDWLLFNNEVNVRVQQNLE